MTATAAEALELALWLHRAPARRAALLGRPLPAGIAQLLRVAGGAPDQVAAAALITGENEATVLEAVRFYLQQILFHEDADAHRVLGLNPGASQSQAREHHRLLQHWLHPDRRGPNEWESVYATRVNRAWTELRSGRAAPPGGSRFSGDQASTPAGTVAFGGSRFSGDFPRQQAMPVRRRSRSKVATLLVLAACVGLVIAIALRNETPPEWRDPRDLLATAEPAVVAPPPREEEAPDSATLLATLDALAAEAARHAEAARSAIVESAADAVATPAVAMAPAPTTAPPVATPVKLAIAPPVPEPRAAVAPADPARARPAPAEAPAAVLLAAAEPVAAPPAPEPEPEAAPITEPAKPVLAIPDPMARMAQARDRVGKVSAFLGDLEATPPPVWNDMTALRSAQVVRAELHHRLGMPRRVDLRLHDTQWRLGADGARLQAAYRAAKEQGRLDISFTWRQDQLLVRSIALVPGA